MRLFARHAPDPSPPPHAWRPFGTPGSPPPAHDRRPLLSRLHSAPAHMQTHHVSDYFSLPGRHPRPPSLCRRISSAVTERVDRAENEAEAGCLRLVARAVRWWLWRRWRRT